MGRLKCYKVTDTSHSALDTPHHEDRMPAEKKPEACLGLPLTFLFAILFTGAFALLNNNKSRPLLKFCFNSRDQFVQAQCVLCDFYQFSATVLGCNGRTSALMSNITSTEAVCIISNCLQQVRQAQPQFTGRRRRDSPATTTTTQDPDRQEVIEERKDLSLVAPSVKEFMNRYVMLDAKSLRELEDRVVDKIEVTVDAEDEDYEN